MFVTMTVRGIALTHVCYKEKHGSFQICVSAELWEWIAATVQADSSKHGDTWRRHGCRHLSSSPFAYSRGK